MSGQPGRSGITRYPYPVTVGDVVPLQALTREAYHRLRSAAYKRAESLGHRLTIRWREGRTCLISRVA